MRRLKPLVGAADGGLGRMGAGFAWSALALAILSGWFVVTRLVVVGDLRVWDVVALRFGGGAVVVVPIILGECRRLPRRAWLKGLQLSVLWGAPFVLLVAFGLRLTSAADASSVTPGLMPVFAGAFAWAASGERPAGRRLAGYAVILAGAALLVWAGAGAGVSVVGLAALVAAAAMWAAYTLLLGGSGLTPIQAVAFVCFWSAALYLPAYVLSGVSLLPRAPWSELAFQAVYQGALMSVVAILAFNRAVALLGPAAAAAMTALIPAVATGMGQAVLGEAPSAAGWLAIVLIAAGVVLAAAVRRPSLNIVRTGTAPAPASLVSN